MGAPASAFLNSLSVDQRLAHWDLIGSIAHVEMLGRVGLLRRRDVRRLIGGLRQIAREMERGKFRWRSDLEDVHTNIEVRLTELLGIVGQRLHTGRSRNDQVALDERLFLRAAIADLMHGLLELTEVLRTRAKEEVATPMPGYTHLQRAQPITLGHHLLAHVWRFSRDLDRLQSTAERANISPLGAGALAGSTLPLDPAWVARRLGFSRSFANSVDAVSDRDPFAEVVFDLALASVHASCLAEELVIWSTSEFGFVAPGPEWGGGSSLMPQKRNPDVAELVRGKSGRVIGDLVALLVTLKGLPLAYDRDLQEDKAPVLDAINTAQASVNALAGVVRQVRFRRDRLLEAASDPQLLATDVVESLVRNGTPFREAHERVAHHFRQREDSGTAALGPTTGLPSQGDGEAELRAAIGRRRGPGGPSPRSVSRQIGEVARALQKSRRFADRLDACVRVTETLLVPARGTRARAGTRTGT
ncbi:MAG: argininosuccinate lyase [Thermoplasmata archaeon]